MSKNFASDLTKAIESLQTDSLFFARTRVTKAETLYKIKDDIFRMFDLLLPLKQQINLICNNLHNFSVSDTLYMDFLKNHLNDEYQIYKKNAYFSRYAKKILKAMKLFNKRKDQFSYLNFSGKVNKTIVLDLTFEDYNNFLDRYYDEEADKIFKNSVDIKSDHILVVLSDDLFIDESDENWKEKQKINPYRKKVKVPKTTFKDVFENEEAKEILEVSKKDDLETKDKHEIVSEDTKENDSSSKEELKSEISIETNKDNSKNYDYITVNGMKFKQYKTLEDRKSLQIIDKTYQRNGLPFYRFDVLDYIKSPEDIKPLFDIETNEFEYPDELRENKQFMFINYNMGSGELFEDYIAIRSIEYLQALNPDTYGLANGLLVICTEKIRNYYLAYRYYEGKFYKIQRLVVEHRGSANLGAKLRGFITQNHTKGFIVFNKYMTERDMEREEGI